MRRVLLVGLLLTNVPSADKITIKNIALFAASNQTEVEAVFLQHHNNIDIVIMGAGIELETRLQIIRYIFSASDTTSVHMKDRASGPEGFIPFINDVLSGLLG
ncbi:hypothetical protein EGT74_03085 [Chitinophaga lutea]|uniref:Uncharacterized protein n=1 Tax=Chitinophaga lutea TaxID=2488634 RepID=A0A3N4PUU1_9BACT|nr:hypothetical protein [Chitinophaga lutea]RPE12553.1 hypothetical protein EGT74_03085 [Chitinophaga lutea]